MRPSDETTCAWVLDMIEPYLDGEVSGEDASRLESHLLSCPACAEELAFAKRTQHTLRHLPQQRCPDSVVYAVVDRVGPDRPAAQRRRPQVWRYAAVAALVLAVAVAVLVGDRPSPPSVTPEELALAERQVKWTLAYVGEITLRSTLMATDDVFESRIAPPVQRAFTHVLETEDAVPEQSEI
jgi:anti-sigma factor (TIGR02949 family)